MNLAVRKPTWALIAGAALSALLLSSCGDHGPTNLYSQSLFGQAQDGAHLEVAGYRQSGVSSTAGVDGLVLYLENTGRGSTIGPLRAFVAVSACASVATYGAAQPTAVFGAAGQVIQPGDVLKGQAVDANGVVQSSLLSYLVTYDLAGCAGTNVPFNVTVVDAANNSWTGAFSAPAQ